jgi:RNA polymerase sigma-70 factor, ECF subfamily
MNQEDKNLIAEAKKEPKKFEKIYRKYSNKVFNYFWYRTGHNKDIAEDLMQETFVRAYTHLPKFTNRGYSYLTYLFTIAHNILVDYYRKPKTVPLDSLEAMPEEILQDFKEEAERGYDAESLWKLIQTLSPKERDLVLMRYWNDMSIKEIATVLGSTENAVKLALSRLRKRLKEHPHVKNIALFQTIDKPYTEARFLK